MPFFVANLIAEYRHFVTDVGGLLASPIVHVGIILAAWCWNTPAVAANDTSTIHLFGAVTCAALVMTAYLRQQIAVSRRQAQYRLNNTEQAIKMRILQVADAIDVANATTLAALIDDVPQALLSAFSAGTWNVTVDVALPANCNGWFIRANLAALRMLSRQNLADYSISAEQQAIGEPGTPLIITISGISFNHLVHAKAALAAEGAAAVRLGAPNAQMAAIMAARATAAP
jgi:hypothetical protein